MRPSDVKDTIKRKFYYPRTFAQHKNKGKVNNKLRPFKIKNGDYVRISHLRNVFTRAFDGIYTGEEFRIHKRYHGGRLPIYRLQEEENKGTF